MYMNCNVQAANLIFVFHSFELQISCYIPYRTTFTDTGILMMIALIFNNQLQNTSVSIKFVQCTSDYIRQRKYDLNLLNR